jgi:anthranilate phosphoribosyltransferase
VHSRIDAAGLARGNRWHATCYRLIMQFTTEIRRLLQREAAEALDESAATRLWGAILDDALEGVEIGAIVAALAVAGETREEIAGLHRAARQRAAHWVPAARARAVAIPAYGVVPGEALVASLAAALLSRFGVPVIVHGILDSPCGLSPARVLRELDVLPCASFAQADEKLAAGRIAFVPVQLLSPALAKILALRSRLGIENTAHLVAPALDPTGGAATCLTFCVAGTRSERFDAFAAEIDGDRVALAWGAGRSPLNLAVRPRIERIRDGHRERLFEADAQETRSAIPLPPEDACGMARWIRRVTTGAVAIPVPALNLVAACLYAVGQAPDFSQAKAIAAINAGRLAA